MNFLKLFIPSGQKKEVTELESWTVEWRTQGESYMLERVNYKVFVKESEADEFITQLKQTAKFLNVWVKTEKAKN